MKRTLQSNRRHHQHLLHAERQRRRALALRCAAAVALGGSLALGLPAQARDVSTAETGPVLLTQNQALNVTNTGSITSTGASVPGVGRTAAATAIGDISNAGSISVEFGVGIGLSTVASVGHVTNSGSIDATNNTAVDVRNATIASITNAAAGTINAQSSGIGVWAGSHVIGDLANSGTINAFNGIAADGNLQVDGAIHNTATGQITAGYDGVQISSHAVIGSVINDGSINVTGGTGVHLWWNGHVAGEIRNNGLIQASDGIKLSSSTTVNGGIRNATGGQIIADNNGIYLTRGATTSAITNEGSITASAAGLFINSASHVTGDVSSLGTIEAAYGIVAGESAQVDGALHNGAGGVITATNYGIGAYSGAKVGSIFNDGTIHADIGGMGASVSHVTGDIVNNGTIDGGAVGMGAINGATVDGLLRNGATGQIAATTNGIVVGGATVGGIANAGTITATNDSAILANAATVTGDITNALGGAITSNGGPVRASSGIALMNGARVNGNIISDGSVTAATSSGISLLGNGQGTAPGSSVGGDLVNTGHITAPWAGISLASGSLVEGAIKNSGRIDSSSGYGIFVGNTSEVRGAIANQAGGVINAHDVGMIVSSSSTAKSISNAGSITADRGISVWLASTVTGNIENTGAIHATGRDGIELESTSSVNGDIVNAAGGTIDAAQHGIAVYSASTVGSIVNAGQINAGHSGIHLLSSTTTGAVTNSGTIQSGALGIEISSSQVGGDITNSGTINNQLGINLYNSRVDGTIHNAAGGQITAPDHTAVALTSGSSAHAIVNDGTITATGYGIALYMGTGTAVDTDIGNNGTMNAGTGIQLSSGAAVTGAIRNAAGGQILATHNGVALASGASVGSIVNVGTITAGDTSILVDATSTVSGGITNSGSLTGTLDIVGTGLIDLDNPGTIDIGQSMSRVSGDYTQTDTGIFKVTLMNVANYLFAPMLVGGDADIDGQLLFGGFDQFNLAIGSHFTLFNIAGTRAGLFSNYGQGAVVGSANGGQYRIDYTVEGDIQLYAQGDVPEPGTLFLLGLGALGFRARWRKAG
jgi:hypothetical protein